MYSIMPIEKSKRTYTKNGIMGQDNGTEEVYAKPGNGTLYHLLHHTPAEKNKGKEGLWSCN